LARRTCRAKTLAAWCANLDAHWGEAVREVGQGTARVWRLYMAGSRLGFDRNHWPVNRQAMPMTATGPP